MDKSITSLQAYMLLYLSIGFMNHVLIEPVLFDKIARDAWISALLAFVPLVMLLPFISYIMNNIGEMSLLEWLKQYAGKVAAILLYIPVIAYLLTMSAITLKDTNDWLAISYLPETPKTVPAIIIIVVCVFAALSGIRTLAILTGILLPFVIIFGYFVMTANFPFKDYSLLLPMLEHGVKPVINGAFYAWGGLIEIVLLLWMNQHIIINTKKVKFGSLLLFCVLLIGLTVGPITGAIAEFGPDEAMKMRYPAFEQWRLVQIGKYIEHLDFLSLYQWMSGTIVRISLALFLVIDIVGLTSKRRNLYLITFISAGLMIFVLFPLSDTSFLIFLSKFYLPMSIVFIVLFLLIISALIFMGKGKQHG